MNKVKVLEFIFPPIAAWCLNRKINEKFKEAEEKRSDLEKEWVDKISIKNVNDVEKMASDIYDLEMERKAALERKATSLISAVGFVISLISVILVIAGKNWITLRWTSYALSFFGIAIFHFIASGISAAKSLKLGPFFQITTDVLKNLIATEADEQNSRIKLNWTVEKLVDVELNYMVMLIRSNWLDASQSLFLRGLYSLGISFVFVALNLAQL